MNIDFDKNTVLIVDDDEFISMALTNLLQLDGYRVLHAVNGKAALHLLENVTPGLILLDMQMPVMNGEEFLNHVRNEKRLNQIPIVIVSSDSYVKKKGATAFLNKSVDLPLLLETIKTHRFGSDKN